MSRATAFPPPQAGEGAGRGRRHADAYINNRDGGRERRRWTGRVKTWSGAIILCFGALASAHADSVCEREMMRASHRHGVPIAVLYAVGQTETGGRGGMQPYLLNIEGRSQGAASAREAVRHFEEARRRGARLIDLGCMQINHHYHGDRFPSVEAMLDPFRNVDYGARFLKDLYAREGSWTRAVARYNAGPGNDPAQQRYVCRVIAKLVASGFGAWTDRARRFCQPPGPQRSAANAEPATERQPHASASIY